MSRESNIVCVAKRSASMLLLIRSSDDVRSTVEAANDFLVYRRRHFAQPREADEVLGVWLRHELDADLPGWLRFDRGFGAGARVDAQKGEVGIAPAPTEAAVGIRESFSRSGLWALCWIDGTLVRRHSAKESDDKGFLDALVKDVFASRPSDPGTFIPVFDATEASDSIDATLRELGNRYPHLVGGTWFVDDRERGIVGPRGAVMANTGSTAAPLVAVIMGSKSDWITMQRAVDMLSELGVRHEAKIVSAHRTPDLLFEYVGSAEARGIQVIIAGAGGAAHLPGMAAAKTTLPVLGVPVQSKTLQGIDSLLSIVQMPKGVPVGTLAIGEAGAVNAALLAAAIIALGDSSLRERLKAHRLRQTAAVLEDAL